MRSWINKFGVIAAGGLILLAIVLVWNHYRHPAIVIEKGPRAYFLDEDTGEESLQSAAEVPPIGNSVGRPCVVRLYKISFDGGMTSQPFYLLKYTEDARFSLQNMKSDDPKWQEVASAGELIRRPGQRQKWVAGTSPEAAAIRELPVDGAGKQAEIVEPKPQ